MVLVAGLVRFDEQDVEDIVNFPFPELRKLDGEWRDDPFDLEWPLVLVVQRPRLVLCLGIVAVEYYQVTDLVYGVLLSLQV
jgi:hypothetical protein